MARPNKYETHVAPRLEEIKDWVRNGATDEQVAQRLGINPDTLYTYKKKFSEFSEILKESKDVVDSQVESALLKRALGYSYDEVTQEIDENGKKKIKKISKKVAPDVLAQIFWLKNRRPKEWREKPVENTDDLSETINVNLKIEDLSGGNE